MGEFRELKLLLALVIIGLFSLAAYQALSIASFQSSAKAYGASVLSVFAFVWGLMCWLVYEDPVRFREVLMVSILGFMVLAGLEVGVILTGQAASGTAVSPMGPSAPLEDALWGEVVMLASLSLLLYYFRPKKQGFDQLPKESL